MPALVAARFNPDLKAKHQQLIKAGKPPKVAITAVMRELIALANALLNQRRSWAPKPT
jgi:transposase